MVKKPRCGHQLRGGKGPCARPLGHKNHHSTAAAVAKAHRPEREWERRYGITGNEYAAIKEAQGGKCFLCRTATGKARRLAVDHDHNVHEHDKPTVACRDCVRGLLCMPCNRNLGWAEFVTTGRLIEYLMFPPAKRAL